MGRNAQRRRAAKDAARATRTKAPRKFLSLPDYLAAGWGVSHKQAVDWLLSGRVNVNGEVWAYPEVPIDTLNVNDQGNYRIMVEGVPDPRPPRGALILKGPTK